MIKNLNNKSILVTGGTGSFGQEFVKTILQKNPSIKRLVVFSRDELKQYEMAQKFPEKKYPGLRFFLGDIRDKDRLTRAFQDIDIVIHAAALKQVPTAEYNPMEFIKTNIIGAQNIIEAAIDKKISKVVALSTDKATSPINLYGATKLCSDKLFVAANNYAGLNNFNFSVVRYGNVMGSRGSIIPFFLEKAKTGELPITDLNMTRFNITLKDSVTMVLYAIQNSLGGGILVPKIPSYKIMDIAKAIGPNCKIKLIGIRPGEKIHEELVSSSDSINTIDIGKYYIILPSKNKEILKKFSKVIKFKHVKNNFSYSSGANNKFLKVNELRNLIKLNIDKKFKPI